MGKLHIYAGKSLPQVVNNYMSASQFIRTNINLLRSSTLNSIIGGVISAIVLFGIMISVKSRVLISIFTPISIAFVIYTIIKYFELKEVSNLNWNTLMNENEADAIGKFAMYSSTIKAKYGLYTGVVGAATYLLIMLIITLFGVSWAVSLIMSLPAIGAVFYFFKKRNAVKLKLNSPTPMTDFKLYENESLIDYVSGIIMWPIVRISIGVRRMKHPQNAILITNKRLIFIVVPVFGAGMIINGVSIPELQFSFARKGIREKLTQLINSVPIEKIVNSDKDNFWIDFNELEDVKFNDRGLDITFILKNNNKIKCVFGDKSEYNKIKDIVEKLSI